MRKIFLISLIIICCSVKFNIVKAQKNKFIIGINVGPNISSLRITKNSLSLATHKSVIGFSGGFSIDYLVWNKFSLKSGIYYEKKGNIAITKSCLNEDIINNSKFQYYTLPLMLKKSFGENITYFVNGGVFLGYLGNAKMIFTQPNGSTDNASCKSDYKKIDFGLDVGAGLIIPLNKNFQFSLEFNENFGLTNISNVFMIDGGTIKTNTFNLLFGVKYKF